MKVWQRVRFVLFALSLSLSMMAAACSRSETSSSTLAIQRPGIEESVSTPGVKQAVETNIQDKYAWERSRYIFQFRKEEGGLEMYFIGNMDDQPRPGGGKSFFLYFDRATLKGVRELHMQ